jgi:hypothetical protein
MESSVRSPPQSQPRLAGESQPESKTTAGAGGCGHCPRGLLPIPRRAPAHEPLDSGAGVSPAPLFHPSGSGAQGASKCRGVLSLSSPHLAGRGFWSLDLLNESTRRVADGSRRSPRVFRGGDLRATAQERACTPAGCQTHCCRAGSRLALPQNRFLAVRAAGQVTRSAGPLCRHVVGSGTPSPGCWTIRCVSGGLSPSALNDHPLPSANPAGWPPPPSSAENVQPPCPAIPGEGGLWKGLMNRAISGLPKGGVSAGLGHDFAFECKPPP